ncbi:MAG: TetR/AcrR family transcriptional regulator [Panacagrimonas sp.]|jgi:AcrR family transcriptional regulator|nr:TetR/AcrR family transcriptional regulator [Panacagrimonas sp.]MCC2656861.1 TetR/AcrR family transcriptional regulator [Panacagrimonas sp.]
MARPALTNDERAQMRRRLADAALSIHLEQGSDAVSFRALAEAVGISHTLIYRYVEDKDELLAQVRAAAVGRFEAFVRSRERDRESRLERLRTVFDAYVEYVRRNPAEYLLIFSTEQPSPDAYPELLAARRSLFEHAVESVQACVDAGEIQGDARRITHAFWGGLHGLMTLHVNGQLVHGCDLDELAPALLNLLLGAVLPNRVTPAASRGVAARRRSPGRKSKPNPRRSA